MPSKPSRLLSVLWNRQTNRKRRPPQLSSRSRPESARLQSHHPQPTILRLPRPRSSARRSARRAFTICLSLRSSLPCKQGPPLAPQPAPTTPGATPTQEETGGLQHPQNLKDAHATGDRPRRPLPARAMQRDVSPLPGDTESPKASRSPRREDPSRPTPTAPQEPTHQDQAGAEAVTGGGLAFIDHDPS